MCRLHDPASLPAQRRRAADADEGPLAWQDVLILTTCAVVGGLDGAPAGAAHSRPPLSVRLARPQRHRACQRPTGSKPPDGAERFAQSRAAIGGCFGGMALGHIAHSPPTPAVSAVVMLALTVTLLADPSASDTGYPLPAVVLAFAVGGLAEMSLIALALARRRGVRRYTSRVS